MVRTAWMRSPRLMALQIFHPTTPFSPIIGAIMPVKKTGIANASDR